MQTTILRLPAVKARIGLSRSTIYLRISQGRFPKPINLGGRAVGWNEADVNLWLEQQIEVSRGEFSDADEKNPTHSHTPEYILSMAWLDELAILVDRFEGLGITQDLASMDLVERWGLYLWLSRKGD